MHLKHCKKIETKQKNNYLHYMYLQNILSNVLLFLANYKELLDRTHFVLTV